MILILSSNEDDHAQAVLKCLAQEKAEATLLDLARFPQQLQLAINIDGIASRDGSILTDTNEDMALSSCSVIWWRRPQPFNLHPTVADSTHRLFAHNECHSAFSGLWLTLDAFWVNHPIRDEEASRKAYQLKVAKEIGFDIPSTLITNSPERARAFVDCYGPDKTIYKSFSATEHAWRETRLLKPDEVALLDSVCYAPVIFQEYILAQLDLRITVVGTDVFSVAIYSQDTSYKVDYRMDMNNARVEAFKLPTDVIEHLQALMKRLGLVYGAIDMRLTPEGQYVFLEINPSGQWLFMEERSGLPITTAFTRLLSCHQRL